MVDFYKEKNFQFKLKDLEVTEQFTLWQGWGQTITDEEMKTQYGVVLTFPVKEGSLPGVDKIPRDVQSDIKMMKKRRKGVVLYD